MLPALAFATHSPYSGWQTVANSRNVMRHLQRDDKNVNIFIMQIK
jgi:hypothetical protein